MIERASGEILFIRRPDHDTYPGYWSTVTGAREDTDASLEATCIREAREEVGLDIAVIGKMWESTTTSGHFRLHWFLARLARDPQQITPDPHEVSGHRWLRPNDVAAIDHTFDDTRHFFANEFAAIRARLLAAQQQHAQ